MPVSLPVSLPLTPPVLALPVSAAPVSPVVPASVLPVSTVPLLPVVGASVPDPPVSPPVSPVVVGAVVVGPAVVGAPVSSACVVPEASVGPAEAIELADSPSFDPPQAASVRSVSSARGARMAILYGKRRIAGSLRADEHRRHEQAMGPSPAC